MAYSSGTTVGREGGRARERYVNDEGGLRMTAFKLLADK
jgi:hypothetical protein